VKQYDVKYQNQRAPENREDKNNNKKKKNWPSSLGSEIILG
jgi:hypothetical protein